MRSSSLPGLVAQEWKPPSRTDALTKQWQERAPGGHVVDIAKITALITAAGIAMPEPDLKQANHPGHEPGTGLPRRTFSVSMTSLGDDRFGLRFPITVMIEDYGDEIVASWPEIEAWGAGETEADALNALKDDVVRLCEELLLSTDIQLGKLPMRWAMSLRAVVASGANR